MRKARELRLAKRMARLGTETAFEVLAKARALEAKGRDIVHLDIGGSAAAATATDQEATAFSVRLSGRGTKVPSSLSGTAFAEIAPI